MRLDQFQWWRCVDCSIGIKFVVELNIWMLRIGFRCVVVVEVYNKKQRQRFTADSKEPILWMTTFASSKRF